MKPDRKNEDEQTSREDIGIRQLAKASVYVRKARRAVKTNLLVSQERVFGQRCRDLPERPGKLVCGSEHLIERTDEPVDVLPCHDE